MNDIETKYGQFVIRYSRVGKKWRGFLGNEEVATSQDLESLEKTLDKHGEVEKKFTKIPCFMKGGYNDETFIDVVVTSFPDEFFRGGTQCWITRTKDKQRKKDDVRYLYLDTPDNRQAQVKIIALMSEIKKLEKEKEALYDTMQHPQPNKVEQEEEGVVE